jgi:uncharacterized membrane protein (UPF0136 family)
MATLNFIGAALVGLGGIVGYVKTQSLPSLVVGLTFALLIILASQRIMNPETKQFGTKLALGLWLLLAALMGYRYYNSQKFFPAGLVFFVGAGLSIFNYLQLQ